MTLTRHTPLPRGKGPQRRTPLKRASAKRAQQVIRAKRPRDTGPSAKVRGIVRERSGGQCEFAYCLSEAIHVHHRRPRGDGGDPRPETNRPSNLVHLCLDHHLWVESYREEAGALGLLMPWETKRPAGVPVALRHGRVLLDDEGGWRAA